ncbi:unnamed protein product [Ectocarpus sp. 8 AP-2014]
MDSVALVQGALAPLRRARDATEGVTDLKTSLRRRYGDYSSIMESLKSNHDVVAATKSERELMRLTELFTRVADLIGEYTAAPGDGRFTKFNVKSKRAADWENVKKELDEIDCEVMRQLEIMNLKGAFSSSEMELLEGVYARVDQLTSLVEDTRPPNLSEIADANRLGPTLTEDDYWWENVMFCMKALAFASWMGFALVVITGRAFAGRGFSRLTVFFGVCFVFFGVVAGIIESVRRRVQSRRSSWLSAPFR